MDKLSRDAANALAAGMSYGKYMAMKNPVKITSPEPKGVRRECECCGKAFYRQDRKVRKFCSDACREKFYGQRKAEARTPRIKVCTVCGKEFEAGSCKTKYCGDLCRRVAQNEAVKQYQARKKDEPDDRTESALPG